MYFHESYILDLSSELFCEKLFIIQRKICLHLCFTLPNINNLNCLPNTHRENAWKYLSNMELGPQGRRRGQNDQGIEKKGRTVRQKQEICGA